MVPLISPNVTNGAGWSCTGRARRHVESGHRSTWPAHMRWHEWLWVATRKGTGTNCVYEMNSLNLIDATVTGCHPYSLFIHLRRVTSALPSSQTAMPRPHSECKATAPRLQLDVTTDAQLMVKTGSNGSAKPFQNSFMFGNNAGTVSVFSVREKSVQKRRQNICEAGKWDPFVPKVTLQPIPAIFEGFLPGWSSNSHSNSRYKCSALAPTITVNYMVEPATNHRNPAHEW